MKIKIYLFRFVVASAAFILSLVFFNLWQNAESVAQNNKPEAVVIQPPIESEIPMMPSSAKEMPIVETTSAPDSKEADEYEFDAGGNYYIFSYASEVKPLSKPFEEFNEISITTFEYAAENDYNGTPIPPKGYVFAKRKYKFSRINIANRQIAFETEAKKGISYKFVGKFVDSSQRSEDDYADLEGQLIKMRDGKKIAETKVRLAADRC